MIGSAINSNKLTGGAKFVDEIERRIGIIVETRKPERPAAGK
jgi:putative transposase